MKTKLPEGWREVELKDVCEIVMGQSPPGHSYNYKHNGTPFFQGKAEFGKRYPEIKKWTTSPSKVAKPNDILMSVRAPVGSVNICNVNCCIGRGLAALRAEDKLDKLYLFHTLQFKEKEISNLGTGSTFKAITSKQLNSIKIILPPLSTQHKIVSILEKAEKAKEWRKESDKLTDNYLKSVFFEMFGGKNKFETKKLKEIGYLKHGFLYRPVDYVNEGIKTVRIGDFDEEDVNTNDSVKVDSSNLETHKEEIIRKGDVIIALSGATTGKSCLVKKDIVALQNYRVGRIVTDKKIVLSEYIAYFVKTNYFQSLIKNSSVVSAQPNISKENFDNFDIPLPPLHLQQKFASIVKEVEAMKEQQTHSKEQIDNLFNALMQKAFKGELVV